MAVRFCALLLCVSGLPLAAAESAHRKTIEMAAVAEELGEYDRAAELYLKSYLAGERTQQMREKFHDCQRRVKQEKRHKDSGHQEYAKALPPAEALNLYAEILEKVAKHHADRHSVESLYLSGLKELDRALALDTFRNSYLPDSKTGPVERFRQSLNDYWAKRAVTTPREARQAMQDLLIAARMDLKVTAYGALVLEAVHGVCGGTDESTAYLPPLPAGGSAVETTISRAEIVDAMSGTGLIAINRFREGTLQEFDRAVASLKMQGMQSLIVDLRNNPGGSFPAAIALCERIIPNGPIISTQGRAGEFDGRLFTSTGMGAIDIPLVVMVNGKTMSAAEVVAAAVKESRRGPLVGTMTFGKGSIQTPIPLESANGIDFPRKPRSGILIVTVARAMTIAGAPLQLNGVTPDIVEPNPDRQLAQAIRRGGEQTRGTPQ